METFHQQVEPLHSIKQTDSADFIRKEPAISIIAVKYY